jgi:hypothetical protein
MQSLEGVNEFHKNNKESSTKGLSLYIALTTALVIGIRASQ